MNIEKADRSFHSFFVERMPVGFAYLENVIDNSGKTIDYIFLEVNKSFNQLIKTKSEVLLGKRVTEVSRDGKLAGFDFMDICIRADLLEEEGRQEYYSSGLKKWFLIYSYKSKKNHICVVFHDVTEIKSRTEKINTLYESLVKFNETELLEVDYQWMADEILKLSGATFALVNIFDKEAMKTVTYGFSGLGNGIIQAGRILGYEVIGKQWDVNEEDLGIMNSKRLLKIGRLNELSKNRISPYIVKVIEKILKVGDSFGIGITYNNEILGSFLLIMREGYEIESPDIVELFVNQLGIILLRKKAEEEVKKIDQQYRTAFDGSQDAMFLVNVIDEKSFTYYMINKGYELDVGIPAESVCGMTPRDLYGEEIGRQMENYYIDCLAARKPITYEESFVLLGEKKVWHTLLSPIIKEGNVVQIVGSSRNITELKKWEDEVARERQFFKVTLHSIGDAVITTDTENQIVLLNKEAETLTEWTKEEARGRLLNEVMVTVVEKKYGILENSPEEDQINGNRQGYDRILISKKGSRRTISSSEAFIRDESSNILGVVIVFRDVTMEKQKEEEVRYLGYHDSLTGLYNRAYFEEALTKLDDERYLPLGMIMGDSNGLKMVNDVFGHEEGDKLLRSITAIFKSVCGKDDIIARVGGDEFAVILPRTSSEKMNFITTNIKQRCNIDTGDLISPSIALGAAMKSEMIQNIDEIYKQAEDRMYNNKLVESKSIRSSIITSLKKTLEERTHETEAHAQRMKAVSLEVGKIMELHDSELDELSLLAMLHDIGKIAIPDYILEKPSGLSPDEWKIMKGHCEIGYRIAVASPELAHIASLILSHHERWDGTGYPQELKGMEIPLLSRIITVVDAYDAMTNDRPYHAAIANEVALKELERCSGTQFDPSIVEKVIQVISGTK